MLRLLMFLIILTNFLNASELKKVTLQLSWFDQFQFAGYYIAKEKGFYKDLNLDVEIKPFDFGIDTANGVSQGLYDFGIGRETLLLEKAKDKDLVALYALFQVSPLILLSTKESGISSVKDFFNKRIMTTIDDASEVSLKAMITSEKVSLENLNFLKHTHNINDLINKNTDIISAYISKTPFDLQEKNIQYNVFSPKDYDFDMYSDFLITNTKLIEKDASTVLSFKEASLRGWKYAYNNIDETVELILKKYNGQKISKKALLYEAKELKNLSYYEDNKLGNINIEKLQRIHDLYNIMGLLPKKVNLYDFVYQESSLYSHLSILEKEFIKNNSIITVGENKRLKPFNFLNDIGLNIGIANDYLNIISKKTGLKFIPEVDLSTPSLINKLEKKNIDLLLTSFNLNENDFLKSLPYFKFYEKAFKLKDSNLKNIKKIGIFAPYNTKEKISEIKKSYPTAELLEYKSIEKLIESLFNKSTNIIYAPEEIILTYIKNNNLDDIEYINTKIGTNILPVSMLFHNESYILRSIISKAIKSITLEQHQAIRNKWVPLVFQNNIDWMQVWRISSFILVIIILLIYKQMALRKINKKLSLKQEELTLMNIKLKELSERDHLTQLYNRRYFENVISDILILERRLNNNTSLLMFDIDDFKKVNDTYGHSAGDEVLIKLSQLLKKEGRNSDVIARNGGEEFIILLPNTSIDGAKKHAEQLRNSIEKLIINVDDIKIQITVSMGLTSISSNDKIRDVLIQVDNNLYKAKDEGKNKVVYS